MVDESVRWLLANGRYKEAEKTIRKMARWNKLDYDDVIKRASLKSKEKVPLNKDDNFNNAKRTEVEMQALNGGNTTENGVKPSISGEVEIYTVIDIFRNWHVLVISLICAFTWYAAIPKYLRSH